ncbi:Leucine-rich repeat and immunoglobulin-like domain-containing nogo receptor-interacting protein 1 [Araneus ventricosus]|uniref:Leucine-rich repeat and immunoglobulin-like domain-containing nogo receptor-interacting protein 1 n=1 Tax=Araneus ventricosus TaxID=182803 RepID=A0A4Y2APK8_ARAVE|nr:Leucine-rich repeat and immunoglobulin-like domain-containing nogo receptor-interacting protein 1 [Araneus ventricosus]
MASLRTFAILLVSLKSICSHSGSFSSKSDLSYSEKLIENWPEMGRTCPSICECTDYDYNLIVDCSYKKLDSLPANLESSVFYLNLVGNNISKLSFGVSLKALNSLNVSENRISSIDHLWLNSLQHLEYLDISKNFLHTKAIENVFQNISLHHLNLSKNKLVTITSMMFNQMNSLHSLNLSLNEIETISSSSFMDLNYLISLDLFSNKLTDIQHEIFTNLERLQTLILKQNGIKLLRNVVFSTLKNLKFLDLSENYIASVGLLSFKGLTKLEHLNLSSNYITYLQDGVFRSLESVKILDLSRNPIISIDKIFIHTKSLEFLYLQDLTSLKELTPFSLMGLHDLKSLDISGSKSISDISVKSFSHAQNLRFLDFSRTNLTNLRMGVFNNLHKIETLKLNGNPWKCDCYLYWLLIWLGEHTNTHLLSPSETHCSTPINLKHYVLLDALDHNMVCTNASIYYYTNKTKFRVGSPALLECKVEGTPLPSITWITPTKEAFYWESLQNQTKQIGSVHFSTGTPDPLDFQNFREEKRGRFYLLQNGNLAIQNVERGDGGFYICKASNPLSYASVSIRLTLDYEYLVHIKIVSVLVGMATSFGFLLLTLISVLIKMVMKHFGVKCPCYNGNASPRTQQIKKILESMEHYKKQQLERLRDNYNGQVQRIKDNCMQQMERLRESYSSQAERLRDIKEYGTLQIDRIRENYYFQVQRVRDYSAGQIVRLRENYLFQRNRIRKFSAHHLYKLRENYKVQQQHLNKILENLNIESCRNVCHRTDSIVFEPDLNLENVLVPKICLQTIAKETSDSNDNSSQLSAYFTPGEVSPEVSGHESDESENFVNTPIVNASQNDVAICIEDSPINALHIPNGCEKDLGFEQNNYENNQNSNETIV